MDERHENSGRNDTARKDADRKSSGRRRAIAFATAGAVLLGSAYGMQALAQSKTYAHMKEFAASEGGGWHGRHHGWGRHGGPDGPGRFADMSDAEIEAAITRMVRHVAIEIDATDVQSEKITALLTAVAKDLKPVRDQMRAAGEQVHELLLAETIDRQALERVRTERLAEADRISKNLVNALADVGDVLTAEQRKVLDERIKQFRGMRGGWHRG
ncbi:MAG: Spy/CpxP family protein refolding chaperone [Rhizobiaceae bacterium]